MVPQYPKYIIQQLNEKRYYSYNIVYKLLIELLKSDSPTFRLLYKKSPDAILTIFNEQLLKNDTTVL